MPRPGPAVGRSTEIQTVLVSGNEERRGTTRRPSSAGELCEGGIGKDGRFADKNEMRRAGRTAGDQQTIRIIQRAVVETECLHPTKTWLRVVHESGVS